MWPCPRAGARTGRDHVRSHRRCQPHSPDIGNINTVTVHHVTQVAPPAIDPEIHAQPKADYELDRFWAISDFQLAMLLFWARPPSDSASFTLGSNAFTSVLSCCLVPCISHMHISTNDGADIGISTVQSRAITPTRRKKWFQDTG